MSVSSGEPSTSRTCERFMPGLTIAACSLVTTLPCTTSTLYGVITPRKLSDDCSDWQPASARAAEGSPRTSKVRTSDGREGMVGKGRASRRNLDMIVSFYRLGSPRPPRTRPHEERRRTQEQRPQGHAASHQGARGFPERDPAPHERGG